MKAAFIFDFDGVIVDSERYWKSYGDGVFYPSLIPGWTHQDGVAMAGMGVQVQYKFLVSRYGLTLTYDEYTARLQSASAHVFEQIQLLPGVEDLIQRAQRIGLKTAIASSGGKSWVHDSLHKFRLATYLEVVCTCDDVGERTKPLPDLYLLAAKKLGIDPADCVALEDSRNGLTAAKAAGMTCIVIRTDMNPEQDLTQADSEIRSMDDLTEEVLRSL